MGKTFENIADIMLPDSNFQAAHEMILKNKIEQEDSTPSTGLWKAFDIVCDTAILLILEAAWLGSRRFVEFERSTGLQKALISDRLKYLISEKLMRAQTIAGGKRKEYVFDDRGLALFPAALLMLGWEQKWNGDTGPDIHVIHTDCGHKLIPEVHCKACHKIVLISDLTITKDSAFLDGQQSFVKRRRQAGLNRSGTLVFDEIAQIVGDRWMTLILQTALIGVRRHDDFLQTTGIASNILSDRLTRANENGLIERKLYQTNPPRYEYLLTDKSRDLLPIVLTLMQWGRDWYAKDIDEHTFITHSCGHTLIPYVACQQCGTPSNLSNTQLKQPYRIKKFLDETESEFQN